MSLRDQKNLHDEVRHYKGGHFEALKKEKGNAGPRGFKGSGGDEVVWPMKASVKYEK